MASSGAELGLSSDDDHKMIGSAVRLSRPIEVIPDNGKRRPLSFKVGDRAVIVAVTGGRFTIEMPGGCVIRDVNRACLEIDLDSAIQTALDSGDPVKALGLALEACGAVPTFDRHRSTADPCVVCGTNDVPRDLVQIGTYTRRMGGNLKPGDRIMRPMCASCEKLTTVSDGDGKTVGMTAPAVRSRWIHKGCKRTCIVLKVHERTGARAGEVTALIDFHYIRTAGTTGLMPTRRTPTQTMPLTEWLQVFTKEAR